MRARLATWLIGMALFVPMPALAQTVVEIDLPTAARLFSSQRFGGGLRLLSEIANNYRKHTNVRIRSRLRQDELGTLARALRFDFDGSGAAYLPEVTVWAVTGATGTRVLLLASLLEPDAVLLCQDLDYLRGAAAFELLQAVRTGRLSTENARKRAEALGIEMQVGESEKGEVNISFFGRGDDIRPITGKLVVIDPPELVWN